ncbi:MAG: tetratricopeptide repeat protein [Dehalococcoidales bacterium]|nr:tetratricopeptide repeat protein [Dehalococcoidales bacterium]
MQYEIFRDVLVILISVTAVLGAIIGGMIFFLLRTALIKDITVEVNKQVDKECRKLRGQSKAQAGVSYWMQHRYDNAIEATQQALAEARDVLDKWELIFAESNLGYYYAEKHKQQPAWELKEEAIELTKTGFERYSPSIPRFQKPDWVDNYVYVKATFVKTDKEREEVVQLIDELLLRDDLAKIHTFLEDSKKDVLNQDLTNTKT